MFEPENELEQALVKAADNPASRPQFYKVLVASSIFIIQRDKVLEEGDHVLETDMELQIQNIEIDGEPHIPIFSSPTRIQAVIQEEVGYLGINTLDFLNIVNGSQLVLNPGSEYGKQFSQAEVSAIVDGSIWERRNTYTVEKETRVRVRQPPNYPHELANALAGFFKTKAEVNAAYLAQIHIPDRDDPPHTLVGVLASDNWEEIVTGAGVIVESMTIPDPPVDFMKLDPQSPNMKIFGSMKPFYKKKKFGLF